MKNKKMKWKCPYVTELLLKKLDKASNSTNYNQLEIKTMSRNTTILSSFISFFIYVHNGKTFSKIKITKEMVGYKLGEFSPTRKRFSYKKKKHMGQKTNPVILRQSLKKSKQNNEFFEKNNEESSLYTYKSLEIKNYLNTIFFQNGLILCDCKIGFSNNNLSVFISYYVSTLYIKKKKPKLNKKKKNF